MAHTRRTSFMAIDSSEPDVRYYNCSITNVSQETNPNYYPTLSFRENRTLPFIEDVSQYDYSIVRFTMDGPGKALPLFIPSVDVQQSDINRTVYAVGLGMRKKVGGVQTTVFTQRFVKFESESAAWYTANPQSLPGTPTRGQDISNDYYYVSTYQHWLNLINKTIQECATGTLLDPGYAYPGTLNKSIAEQWAMYWAAAGSGPVPAITTTAPSITYSGSGPGGLFALSLDSFGFGGPYRKNGTTLGYAPTQDEEWYLYMDTNLYNLFFSLPSVYIGAGPQVFQIAVPSTATTEEETAITYDVTTSKIVLAKTGVINYVLTQETESTSTLWSPVENITFCTTAIPVLPEATGPPNRYGTGTQTATSTAAVSPIITDIAVQKTDGYAYNQFIAYVPSGEYRMAALTGSGPLQDIDVQVFWRCRNNNQLVPLALPNGSTVSLKMMFRRKR